MSRLAFARGHGLGNDYIVLDAAALPWPLTPARVRRLCDRHRGIGSDGILLGHLDGPPFRLEIFNPDGTTAEKSGNGLRIFGAFLHRRGLVAGDAFTVRLPRDEVTMTIQAAPATGILDITVEMGRADFRGEAVGFTPVPGEALRTPLELPDGEVLEVNPVSLANPHCVVLLDGPLDRADFLRRGPQLATHAAFPAGTNVQLARVLGPDRLQAWIWERGAGETLASGSSACAVAAIATRLGLVSRGDELTVEMEGGSVRVRVADDYSVRLRGDVEIILEGELTEELTSRLAAE